MPEPISTPVRSASSCVFGSTPASAIACVAAAIPKMMKGSTLRCSLTSIQSSGLNLPSASGPSGMRWAIWQAISSTWKSSMRLAPLLLARMFAQVVSTPHPRGVTAPIPVTTTRRSSIDVPFPSTRSADGLGEVTDGITEGLDRLGGVIGDFDGEFFFEGHHQLDLVEGIGAQVVDEAGLVGHLLGIDIEVLHNDLADAVSDIAHSF